MSKLPHSPAMLVSVLTKTIKRLTQSIGNGVVMMGGGVVMEGNESIKSL